MPIRKPTLAVPLRSQFEAPGPNYTRIPPPAQPGGQTEPKGRQPMSRYHLQRLYGVFTAVAIVSLLSPLVMASATFMTVPR